MVFRILTHTVAPESEVRLRVGARARLFPAKGRISFLFIFSGEYFLVLLLSHTNTRARAKLGPDGWRSLETSEREKEIVKERDSECY